MSYDIKEMRERLHIRQLEGLGQRLEDDIVWMLDKAGIYYRVFNRIKTPESISRKLEKEGYGFGDDEKKLQDVIGLRVIVYYSDDMKVVKHIIDKIFRRDGEWSKTENNDDEFKASKLNGVFYIPDEYMEVYNGDLGGYPIDYTFEVQLRTVSFEGWHEIEHDMRYKSPYGGKFWEHNEELSRILNSILANLELCDWTTISVFDKLASFHYEESNWEMMLKSKFRLKFDTKPLSYEIIDFLNEHPDVASAFIRADRITVIYELLREERAKSLTYDRLVKVANSSIGNYDEKTRRNLAKICNDLTKDEKIQKNERQELDEIESTPCFRLNVKLTNKTEEDVPKNFMKAIEIIGTWAQAKFRNIMNDIPTIPVDYEKHLPGFHIKILGNLTLGFYKLSLEHIDPTRLSVVWTTHVSLEKSSRGIYMKVEGDYSHIPERLVKDSFSKPRFVDEIFKQIGFEDVIPLSLKPSVVNTIEEVGKISELLKDSKRELPVILAVENEDSKQQINLSRLAETVGTYAHVFVFSRSVLPELAESSDYTKEELEGSVWVNFKGGDVLFFTKEMIASSRFDLDRYVFDRGDVNEKAFRHKLVRLIKEKNCRS